MFLDEYEAVPYKVLNFLTSYINYGGRVTDDKDLRTIDVILKVRGRARLLAVLPFSCVTRKCGRSQGRFPRVRVSELARAPFAFFPPQDYFCESIMVDGYKFSVSGLYHTISCDPESPHKDYMEYIDSLPLNPDPEAFGMHANANITSDQNDTYEMFDLLLSLQPRSASGGGKSREEMINEIVDSIRSRLPGEYDVEAVSMQYPVKYEDSMNTVLVQVT